MGASLVYLEKPNTEVEFEEGSGGNIRYGVGEMQGWRLNMVSKIQTFLTQSLLSGRCSHFSYELRLRTTLIWGV